MEAQTRLLRVLQQGEYTTVGGRTAIKTNVRIVAATNKDLRQLIQQGLFREDMFFRLNVVPIRLPPLRERSEDIPDLVRHFFAAAEKEGLGHKLVDRDALDVMRAYGWPGNIRELENLVRRLAALYPQESISAQIVMNELQAGPPTPQSAQPAASALAATSLAEFTEQNLASYFSSFGSRLPPPGLYHRVLRELEGPLLTAALYATRGNQIKAAELLGLNRNTLRKKIRDLDLKLMRHPG
ncbi:MAG: sigma 54-interacting transcriptional regulator, partial [Beijerinckiaceae bacterium]